MGFSQTDQLYENRYPVFPECEAAGFAGQELCFEEKVKQFIHQHLEIQEQVAETGYQGKVHLFFEVTKTGRFRLIYAGADSEKLKSAIADIFDLFPVIQPATYNGNPVFMQFDLTISFPLRENIQDQKKESLVPATDEYDAIKNLPYLNEAYKSNLNIPLTHHNYAVFDGAVNRVGTNSHTAQKPYLYSEIRPYFDFENRLQDLSRPKTSWFGRKFWNEHMVTIKGKDYWITLDPGVDLQAGKDLNAGLTTYNNTRMVFTQGGIGKRLSFFAVIYESQGRFADYFNRYAESIAPDGGNPAVIPGRGIAKWFNTDSYDYPLATGYISYTPSAFLNAQFGHGKTFIGDGYRSLFVSDNASPYPYLKLNTTFWKIKYTNTWMWLRDVRRDVTDGGTYRQKYMANHYLSYNITKRLNLGFFESVVWENDNNQGFDINYLNPVIFYHSIEFASGSRGGNALIGISGKYKISDRFQVFGQFVIDEFSSSDVFGGTKSYKNKNGYQLGAKYFDAFGVKNLLLQAEFNRIRPYTYSHNTINLNYGHTNQTMAHPFGANFSEAIAIARYHHNRWFGDLKLIYAERGLDFNSETDRFSYGGDIFRSEKDRPRDLDHKPGQGNKTDFFFSELQLGYLINPSTNLKIYGSFIFRDFKPHTETESIVKENTGWINFGIRTDLFNWHYDF